MEFYLRRLCFSVLLLAAATASYAYEDIPQTALSYQKLLANSQRYRIGKAPVRVVVGRFNQESFDFADRELFRIGLLLREYDLAAKPIDPSLSEKITRQLRLLGTASRTFLDRGMPLVVIADKSAIQLSRRETPDLFRQYMFLHETFGHGNLVAVDNASRDLYDVLRGIIPEKFNNGKNFDLTEAAVSIFHESYSDIQAVVISHLINSSVHGREMIALVKAFRQNTVLPVTNDCHDTSASLALIEHWISTAESANHLDQIRLMKDEEAALAVHKVSLTLALGGMTQWVNTHVTDRENEIALEAAITKFYEARLNALSESIHSHPISLEFAGERP